MNEGCPACGAPGARPWRVAHQLDRGRVARGWSLKRCGGCGSAWLADPPTAEETVALHEGGAYAPATALSARLPQFARWALDRDRIRLLGPLPPRARVIEIGAGRGRLLAALGAAGHDASGVDPSSAAANAAGPGIDIRQMGIEDARFPPGEADAVVLWHVLEHLEEPQEALVKAARWLRPGGCVIVAAPNLASLQARLGGDRWFHQDVPRHRTQFTAAGLGMLLRRRGFAPAAPRHVMLEQNALGMWLTLLNYVTVGRDVPFRAAKRDLSYARRTDAIRDAFLSMLAGIPLMPLAGAAELAAGLAGAGGTVVVRGELEVLTRARAGDSSAAS